MSNDTPTYDQLVISNSIPEASAISINANGGPLIKILRDGTVEAPSLEAASEAGRVFVESVRGYLGKPEGSRYAKLTVPELEAELAAIECALAARKAELN